MGYIHKAYSAIGTEVYLNVRGKMLKAKIVKMPFINHAQ
jgi:aminomethyltransferase